MRCEDCPITDQQLRSAGLTFDDLNCDSRGPEQTRHLEVEDDYGRKVPNFICTAAGIEIGDDGEIKSTLAVRNGRGVQ